MSSTSALELQVAQVEAAISALEAQRSVLGDAVVETALAPLRQQLAELRGLLATSPGPSLEGERRLVKPWVSKYPTSATGGQFWKDVVIEPH